MRYIFYADVYFLQNFMIKVAVLYLALYANKLYLETTRVKWLAKLCIASGIGTLIEIVGLLICSSYHVFVVCVHLFEVPLMVRYVIGRERRRIIPIVLSGYFFIVLINGVLEVLWNQFGQVGSYIFFLLFSCGVVLIGVRMWRNYCKMKKGIFRVQLLHQGKSIEVNGFYDSGNRLTDPYTGRGVQIITAYMLDKLQIVKEEGFVYIQYQALGNEKGILEVYYIDEIIIDGEKGRVILQKSPVGVTKDNLFEGKNYEIILNEEVF